MDDHDLSNGKCLLNSMDVVLIDSLNRVQRAQVDFNDHYDVLPCQCKEDAVALSKLLVRPEQMTIYFVLL